jgi:hypothetical protein
LVVAAGRDDGDELGRVIRGLGHDADVHDPERGTWRVVVDDGDEAPAVAAAINLAAHRAGIVVHELQHVRANLESRYLDLVSVGGHS